MYAVCTIIDLVGLWYNARPLAKWNGGHWRLLRLRSLPLCEVKWLGVGHTHGSAHFCSWCRCLILWWVVGKGKWRDHQAAGARWGMQYVMYPSIHPPPDRHIMQTRQSNELRIFATSTGEPGALYPINQEVDSKIMDAMMPLDHGHRSSTATLYWRPDGSHSTLYRAP